MCVVSGIFDIMRPLSVTSVERFVVFAPGTPIIPHVV